MESASQKDATLIYEMTKIAFFSIKAILVLCTTWLVAPFAEMVDQINGASTPPLLFYYLANILIWTHELALLIKPVREAMREAFTRKGRLDIKQSIAVWFSLMCIRMFCIGKLNEIWYPEHSFSGETYYQLIGLISVILGITATSNMIEVFFKKK